MNELQKLQEQLASLTDAQTAVAKMYPEDIDTYRQLAGMISDLQYKLLALASNPQIQPLTTNQVQTLQNVQQQLAAAVNSSAGATQILQAATALAKA